MPTVRIYGKFSIYCPYIMDYFPYILISNIKQWKKYGSIFHLSWYLVDIMENKRKFSPDPGSRGVLH